MAAVAERLVVGDGLRIWSLSSFGDELAQHLAVDMDETACIASSFLLDLLPLVDRRWSEIDTRRQEFLGKCARCRGNP